MNKWSVVGFVFGLVCIGVVGYILLDMGRDSQDVRVTERASPTATPVQKPQATPAVQRPTTPPQTPQAAPDKPQYTPAKLFLTREVRGSRYQPGGTVDVAVSFLREGTEPITAMGMEETLPEGWTFEGYADQSGALPDIKRVIGNKVEFAWFNIPEYPATFAYRVRTPADASGVKDITGEALYRTSGDELRTGLIVTPVEQGEPVPTTAAAMSHAQPSIAPAGQLLQQPGVAPSAPAAIAGSAPEAAAPAPEAQAANQKASSSDTAKAESAPPAPEERGIVVAQSIANPSVAPGEVVQIDLELGYAGTDPITAVGLQTVLPSGWAFEGIAGGAAPAVAPPQGRTGILEFAWIEVPEWPARLSYRVRIPENESASRELATTALYHTTGDLVTSNEVRTTIPVAAP